MRKKSVSCVGLCCRCFDGRVRMRVVLLVDLTTKGFEEVAKAGITQMKYQGRKNAMVKLFDQKHTAP